MQHISLHKGAAGWREELGDSWDMVLGHNRCLLNVNMLAHRWKEGYRPEGFTGMQDKCLKITCLAAGYSFENNG